MYRIVECDGRNETTFKVHSRELALELAEEWSNNKERVVDVYEDHKLIWQSIPQSG